MSPDNKIIVVFNIRKNKFCIKKIQVKKGRLAQAAVKWRAETQWRK